MIKTELRMTRHALYRVRERISLRIHHILDILKSDKAIPIGQEQGKSRSHYLFYSRVDRQCFIAVIDEADGTVITVLPEDYHTNIGWKISRGAKEMAIKAAGGVEPVVIYNEEGKQEEVPEIVPVVNPAIKLPTRFKITGFVRDSEGKQKIVNICTIPLELYDGKISNLFEDANFITFSKAQLDAKKPGYVLLSLNAQIGNGKVESLPLYSVS